ncbi:Uncharacterised protein [Bordetella pertussis]|nr:Uncharacterised protein [Bordetella pertussis]CFO76029.1 Uncharacterised protein [Bordetella pertussis]CFU85689.1 Uncharacterised protein [Bordetella pertussis]CPI53786.1 Uncharacterised protein [Bordetella pertussis]CPL85086.1 Uncharacterised protein [Bordetella pertussis]
MLRGVRVKPRRSKAWRASSSLKTINPVWSRLRFRLGMPMVSWSVECEVNRGQQ